MDKTSKILVLVEGEKTDIRLINHLIKIYGIDCRHSIVSYNTNIYVLYQEMFLDSDPSSMDLLQLLKERENDPLKKEIFNGRYSDILLIFDLDPQDPLFTNKKIIEMLQYFIESSDMGKLYINYPMVESFYHMKSIPDKDYNNYTVLIDEISGYKKRVNKENRNHDYSKFATTRKECNLVIRQNIDKAWFISGISKTEKNIPKATTVLTRQIEKINFDASVWVLCTCVFFIIDYNPLFVTVD